MIKAQQSGDTTAFNADAYKTNPDATAEDLLTKMPGITKEGGVIKAQGEEVKKILVDGKPFFGDDPNATLQNLPAEIIDKIQLYDNQSDQSLLTGFDDGNAVKAINIITKKGKNNGWFGRVYAGGGTEEFNKGYNLYTLGGAINYFNGDRRISVLGMSNNINIQNFSSDDLSGAMGSTGGGSRGGGGNRGGGGAPGGRGGGGSNFMVGNQGGITQTNSLGVNYSDVWAKGLKASGSYFYNNTNNNVTNDITRNYFTNNDSTLVYRENSTRNNNNTNHRANLRLEYDIDSSNTIIYSGSLSYQDNISTRNVLGENKLSDVIQVSNINNQSRNTNKGLNLNNNLTYRHKFAKKGRTFSIGLNHSISDREGEGFNYSSNNYSGVSTILDQQSQSQNSSTTYGANLTYTEPLSQTEQLMFNYAPTLNKRNSEKLTYNKDALGDYNMLDTNLSNKFDNDYITHRAGAGYRKNSEKLSWGVGLDYQYASLEGAQIFPYQFEVNKSFQNVLPNAMLNYKINRTENIRVNYRTRTNVPSITQLQNVIDNSNVLQLNTGNENLNQSYQHTLTGRYGKTSTSKGTNFFVMLTGNYTTDYITNETFIAQKDTMLNSSVTLYKGSQLSRPVNLDGYYSMRSFVNYGFPLKSVKSNLNLNAGISYSRLPGLVNRVLNISNNTGVNGGFVLSSNVSQNIDFTLTHNSAYNIVNNTIRQQANSNYYSQTTTGRVNWIVKERLVLNTALNLNSYSGLSAGYNELFTLWNASVGYKFLKDKSLEVNLAAFDLLSQNRAIGRNVTELYIEDSYTNVLKRHFILKFTYTLRKFGLGGKEETAPSNDMRPPMNRGRFDGPPPGGPMGGSMMH